LKEEKLVIDKAYLKNRIKEAKESIKEMERITSKSFMNLTIDEKYSLRYQIIVLVEAIGSICLHIAIENFNYEPESYSECIKYLEKKGIITNVEDIIKIIRLRNLLIHRYWTIDDFKIFESIKKDFKKIEDFLKNVESKYEIR
jgi:uncharacterized protein YutE (UPF0331/DUF86 family)